MIKISIKNKLVVYYNIAILLVISMIILMFMGYSKLATSLLVNFIQSSIILSIYISLHHIFKQFLLSRYKFFAKHIDRAGIYIYWIMASINILLGLVIMMALLLVWGITLEKLYDWLSILFVKGIKIGETSFSITFLFRAVIIYCTIFYFFKWLTHALEKKILCRTHIDMGTQHAIITVIGYIGLALAIVTAVYSLGVSSKSIAFILSAFTFGISFGLKEIFSNIVSGLILLIERPIKVGDLIVLEDEFATVKKIQLRATVVETRQQEILLVPNSQLITSVVRNASYNPLTRIDIIVECAYEDDAAKVSKLLLNIAKKHRGIVKDPKPFVSLVNFNPSGLEFSLAVFCEIKQKAIVENNLRHRILTSFSENNIEIPYSKQEVYLHTEKK